MAELETLKDVERWLKEPARRREEIIIFAARAALRAMPALARELETKRDREEIRAAVILPVLRAMAAPWIAAKYPTLDAELRVAADAADAAAFVAVAAADAAAARTADAAADAARAAADDTEAVLFATGAAYAAGAAAAAYAVTAATGAATSAAVKDANLLRNGWAPGEVANSPLWHGTAPKWVRGPWSKLRAALSQANEDWDVWIDWYETRHAGAPLGLPLERAWLELSEEDWTQGPAHANRRLKEVIESQSGTEEGEEEDAPAAAAEVPPQRPAALEPVWQGTVLTLPTTPATALSDEDTLKAALQALKENGAHLAKDAEDAADTSNFDKRTATYLRQVAEAIPDKMPPQHVVFTIAHEHAALIVLQGVVNEEWPAVLAARYHAFVLQYDRTIRQFPKWKDFAHNARDARTTPAQAEDVTTAADAMAEELVAGEAGNFIDKLIPERLRALVEWARREIAAVPQINEFLDKNKELLVQDVLESLNNVLKRIAEEVLPVAGEYGGGMRTGARQQARDSGEKDGRRLVKWARRLLVAAASGGLVLTFPEHFSWLQAAVEFLKTLS